MWALVLVSGCQSDRAVVWQKDVVSPDGQYTVHAETVQQSGPGNAAVWTTVELRQTWRESGVMVLDLVPIQLPPPGQDAVRINWRDARHLKLSWAPGSKVTFQAVKAIEVQIEAGPSGQE